MITFPFTRHATLTCLAAMLCSTACMAEVVVIVHPSNTAAIDVDAVSKIYLGQVKTFPGGSPAIPVEQDIGPAVDEFHSKVLNKTDKDLRKLWARQVFTGGLLPPKVLENDDAVLDFVSKTPEAIGYVQAGKVNAKVKAIKK